MLQWKISSYATRKPYSARHAVMEIGLFSRPEILCILQIASQSFVAFHIHPEIDSSHSKSKISERIGCPYASYYASPRSSRSSYTIKMSTTQSPATTEVSDECGGSGHLSQQLSPRNSPAPPDRLYILT